ncbi:MAG: CRISPR-associated protein Cas5 [Bacillota bacterium]
MRVLKITAEGLTTSFRFPHFMQGVHPTYQMPPPATIYGHICSALGEWVPPGGIRFSYHFTYQGVFEDVEHIHVLTAATGRLPQTKLPKVLEGNVNPFKRAILFRPRLVLYLNRPEWEAAFRRPRYAVVLGRSQDLFTYTRVETVELAQGEQAYFEHTIAPYRLARHTGRGIALLMPRYLDYAHNRAPQFSRYILLQKRVYSKEFIQYAQTRLQFYVDSAAPDDQGVPLGLFFHTFTGDEEEDLGEFGEFGRSGIPGETPSLA